MFILSPIGRWFSGIGAVIGLLLAIYLKGRGEGKDALLKDQSAERNRRAKDAIQADDAVRRDISAGRLLDDDGHRRD